MAIATVVDVSERESLARRLMENLRRRFPGQMSVDRDWGENLMIAGYGEVIHCLAPGQATALVNIAAGADSEDLSPEQWQDAARVLTGELLKTPPGPWEVSSELPSLVRRVQAPREAVITCNGYGQAARLIKLSQKISDELLVGKIWSACHDVAAKGPDTLYREVEQMPEYASPMEAWVRASELLRRYELDPLEVFADHGITRPLDRSE